LVVLTKAYQNHNKYIMRYYEIIREGYKEVQQKYVSAGIDPQSIEKTFNTYKDLVNRNQVSGNERNIDWWGKLPFDQFKAFVDDKSSDKSKTQIKRSKIPGKSINLVDNDNWHIVIPLDKDASCFHGKNSDWCTTKPNQSYFEEYFYDKEIILIYCKNNKTGGMWAIAAHKDTNKIEMFDQNDKSITRKEFNSQTRLNASKIVAIALKHQHNISSSRDVYKEALARINDYLKSDEYLGRNAKIEKDLILTKNGKLCYEYVKKIGREDYPEDIQLMIARIEGRPTGMLVSRYIKNPTEKVQLFVVQKDGEAIKYIDNPTEKAQLVAVTEDGNAIRYIKNPSEEVQLAAVTRRGIAIEFIDNPSEQVQLAAFKNSFGPVIKYIIEKGITPSNAVKLAAVNKDGFDIKHIDNPSEQVQLAAVKQDTRAINFIDNPSEEVQLTAVKQDTRAIEWIIKKGITPSEAVMKAAGL